jgi:4-amino-4-deoxychorismate lyase
MADIIIVNGELTDKVSVFDRGLAYGDGVFETVLAKDGRLLLWEMHLQRLTDSLTRLQIPTNAVSALEATIIPYLKDDAQQTVKIIVTRGNSQRGYRTPKDVLTNVVIYISDTHRTDAELSHKGVRVKICETRLAYQPKLAGMKHLNRLEQILACQELDNTDYHEGIMLGQQDEVIEATTHNLFLVKKGELYTPDLSQCGVAGIMRTYIMDKSREIGIPVHTEQVSVEYLMRADELFLSNSLHVIWPICELEGTGFEIGEVTCRLRDKVVEKMYQDA